MFYTLGQAAKVSGKSKPTLARAIKSGKLKGDALEDGSYRIDPAELDRYSQQCRANDNETVTAKQQETPSYTNTLQALLDVLREERGREREQLEGTIGDLRTQNKALAATIEKQSAALAGLSAAHTRALATVDELRGQLTAIEHRPAPPAEPPEADATTTPPVADALAPETANTQTEPPRAARPWLWWALFAMSALAVWYKWLSGYA